MTPGAERFLREESWKIERVINWVRVAVWSLVCGAIVIGSALRGEPIHGGVVFGFVYGIAAAVVGFLWLRHRYHDLVPYVGLTCDIVVLAVIADHTHLTMRAAGDPAALRQLRDVLPAMMLLMSTNALRFSWKVTVWASLCSIAAYVSLIVRHDPSTGAVMLMVHVFHFALLGVVLGVAGQKLRSVIHRMKERDAFARFLPEPVVEQLSRDPSALALGGKSQRATVLFTDIRSFTSLSEKMAPEDVVAFLNAYFAEMVDEVFDCEGVLDKFIGDGICAVFGPPFSGEDQAQRAVQCARGMLTRLEAFNRMRTAAGQSPISIGIGIHTGPLVAGNIGSPRRLEYTHIGDTVNTASRIEAMTKVLDTPLLVSESTYREMNIRPADLVSMGQQALRGREPIEVYGLGT
ncbi:MAG: adenylate/guanylate cyclase domain-containing protein [Myxococcota bacterium]